MQIFKLKFLFLVAHLVIYSASTTAGAIYSAKSTATISLNSSTPTDISFVSIIGNYGALATAKSNGLVAIDEVIGLLNTSNNAVPTLADLIAPATTKTPYPFTGVNAVIGNAQARGRNDIFSSVNVARFEAEAFGEVADFVEQAYSRVRWDILVAFKNTSSSTISFNWDLNYLFSNSAYTDPGGTAFSTSRVRAQQGTFVNGQRNTDPNILEAVTAVCGSTTTCLPGYSDGPLFTLNYNLAEGEIGFLNFEVLAEGRASLVPEPAQLWLYGISLIVFIGFRRHKKIAKY